MFSWHFDNGASIKIDDDLAEDGELLPVHLKIRQDFSVSPNPLLGLNWVEVGSWSLGTMA